MAKRNTGSVLLRAFLDLYELTAVDMAEALGITRQAAWRCLGPKYSPSRWLRQAIDRWTDGKVPEGSWPATLGKGKALKEIVPHRDTLPTA